MARRVLAVVAKYHNGSSEQTLALCDGPRFITGASDTPAKTAFMPRLKQPGLFSVQASRQGATFGPTTGTQGAVIAVNLDGGLDAYRSHGWAGRELYIYDGEEGDAFPAAFTLVFRGTVANFTATFREGRWTLRDRIASLETGPLQTNRYGGTNSLPAGIDGGPEMKDQPMPRMLGPVTDASPKEVNTSKWIWHCHDGNGTLTNVYEGKLALSAGAAYSSQSDMETNAPSAGQYRVWASSAGVYFRLGTKPTKPVTFDGQPSGSASDWTQAQLIKQVAIAAGIDAGDINAADVTALDTATGSAQMGYYLSGTETAREVINALASPITHWWFDNTDTLRMAILTAPSGASAFTLSGVRIVSMDTSGGSDGDNGVPSYRQELEWGRYWTAAQGEYDGTIDRALVADYKLAYRRLASADDTAVQAKHLDSPVLSFKSLYRDAGDAADLLDLLTTIYGTERTRLKVIAYLTAAQLAALDPHVCVTIRYARFGCDSGVQFRVLGFTANLRTGRTELDLWG